MSRRRKVLALDQNATLESSPDALNLKQFDLAFDVDPLFQQTSAQFDEGGAQGAERGGRSMGIVTWMGAVAYPCFPLVRLYLVSAPP